MACELDLNEQKTAKRLPEQRHPGRKSSLRRQAWAREGVRMRWEVGGPGLKFESGMVFSLSLMAKHWRF